MPGYFLFIPLLCVYNKWIHRGGVLEAAGAASIKFREKEVIATAHRIDHVLISLGAQLKEAQASGLPTADIEKQIKVRVKMLYGVYQQVAVHFADLHDTPGRMKAKGVIKRQVMWAHSRTFFYWRLRRRLLEFDYALRTAAASRKEATIEFQSWFSSVGGSSIVWDNDRSLVEWIDEYSSLIEQHVADMNASAAAHRLSKLLLESLSSGSKDVLRMALELLPDDKRSMLLSTVNET